MGFGWGFHADSLSGHVDKRAKDLYYRDIIGNVTTSSVRREKEAVAVELFTRFPMMGGWKIEFYWGWRWGETAT